MRNAPRRYLPYGNGTSLKSGSSAFSRSSPTFRPGTPMRVRFPSATSASTSMQWRWARTLGLSSAPTPPAVTTLFHRANRDPRMGALYQRYLQNWAEAGGGLFMHLLDCSNTPNMGNWGALEYLTQPRSQAPKYDVLKTLMEGR